MDALPSQPDTRLLVGLHTADDAGVVRLPDGRLLIQTLDFFTPVVDDPYTFGAIAAANALSDVYAMGGEPFTAMNILCWPEGDLPESALAELLRGAGDKVREAGAMLVGGHSVKDKELKFGLSVSGFTTADRLWTNAGARPGDALVLTKPLGTGILSTAIKRGACPEAAEEAAILCMSELNRVGRDAAAHLDVHAATDITGFGLTGHAWELARASGVRVTLDIAALPLLPSALDLARAGCAPGGARKNRRWLGEHLITPEHLEPALLDVIIDPQTSGGLLLALPPQDAAKLPWPIIGHVDAGDPAVVLR